eukprot:Hpha_TRINITY_DN7109_c0_g1::TRINITY_DN7109_c0_g1_i1::g.29780::m.29780/K11885/DDI1; DNA damage-inducible protein 1
MPHGAALSGDEMLARRLQAAEYAVESHVPRRTVSPSRHSDPVAVPQSSLAAVAAAGVSRAEVAAQQQLARRVHRQNVATNLRQAAQEMPEAFGRVDMLYVSAQLNGVTLPALVDTGAQTSVISPGAAERCGLHRFVDSRWRGAARGVGEAQILGRVHMAKMTLGGRAEVPVSLTIVDAGVPLILGLDLMRRHSCVMDLKHNRLVISGDAEVAVPFLAAHEVKQLQK